MTGDQNWSGKIRKLLLTETGNFRDHLLRLDRESRRMRFGHGVSDAFIEHYASRMHDTGSIIYGVLDDGVVRAAAELRKITDAWGDHAEAALSVESLYREQGAGTELMRRVIRAGRNRGVRRLTMSCLAENGAMQAMARKHMANLSFEHGEVGGEIALRSVDYCSMMAEALDDRFGFMLAIFDLESRASGAMASKRSG